MFIAAKFRISIKVAHIEKDEKEHSGASVCERASELFRTGDGKREELNCSSDRHRTAQAKRMNDKFCAITHQIKAWRMRLDATDEKENVYYYYYYYWTVCFITVSKKMQHRTGTSTTRTSRKRMHDSAEGEGEEEEEDEENNEIIL